MGSRMTLFAIPWLVLVTTGSPVQVGLVTAAETLTYVISGVLAAPLQDRLGDRVTSIGSDLGSVAALAAIALFGQTDFTLLMVLAAVLGTLRAQADRSKVTMLAPMMDVAGADYARVAAIRESVLRSSTLLGSALAGVVIVFFGAIGGIWIDAASFAVAAVLVKIVAAPPVAVAEEKPPYFAALSEGFAMFRHDRLLRAVTGMLFFTNLFNQASTVVFIPLWVLSNMDDPAALGAVATAYAVGIIAGSFVVAWLTPILKRYPMLVTGYLIGGAPRFLVLALSDNLTVVVVVWLVSGIAMSSLNPTVAAMVYHRTPKKMLARVGGIITAVAFGGVPLGGIIGGLLVESLGLVDAILIATAAYFMASLSPVFGYHLWREIDDSAPKQKQPWIGQVLAGLRITFRYVGGEWTLSVWRRGRWLGKHSVEAKMAVNALARLETEQVHAALNEVLHHDRSLAEAQVRKARQRIEAFGQYAADGGVSYPYSPLEPR
ncbi:putative drug antiporter protein precursor [Rhizocola hellebori]|uniref:Putative drug antiporter protein n=1 Tax=Rhizocola hellebori TaxID=1392758 RepID=A0A8J3QE40_9ACTN|nr:putative drug antiporter protein precursor [Rhizocola hellebori]